MAEGAWEQRWRQLRDEGFDYGQARVIHDLLDSVSAYRYNHVSVASLAALERVYAKEAA